MFYDVFNKRPEIFITHGYFQIRNALNYEKYTQLKSFECARLINLKFVKISCAQ